MGIVGSKHEKPGLLRVMPDKSLGLRQIVRPLDALERETLGRADMRLVLQSHPVPVPFQVGKEALCAVINPRVIGIGA